MDVLPDNIYSSESDEKEFKIDEDSIMNLLRNKISSLKIKDIPRLFSKTMISDLEKEIKGELPILEEYEIVFNYNDYVDSHIKQYIFENYSKEIFLKEDNLYRLYMYVFDPYGEEYANIFLEVLSPEMIYDRSKEENVKQRYIEYLKRNYHENPDHFNTQIQRYFKGIDKTGFDFMQNGSNRRTMKDVAINEKVRCPTNNVKIVNGHGEIVPNEIFRIPGDCKIITLSQTNVCVPSKTGAEGIDVIYIPFMKLYTDGGSIFEEDDSVKEINRNFYSMIDNYKKIGVEEFNDENYLNFQYALHLPGDIITDMYIQTEGSGCEKDGCNIICFEKGEYGIKKEENNYLNYVKFIPHEEGVFTKKEFGDGKMTKLSNILEQMGGGTYIIYACRYTGEENYELSKTFSNNVRGPGYNKPPTGPIRTDGVIGLRSINQPRNIDEKKIYRYHIDFLEDHVDLNQHIEELEKENEQLKQEYKELDEYAIKMYETNYQKKGGGARRRKSRRKTKRKTRRRK